jgi:hypothetical protein
MGSDNGLRSSILADRLTILSRHCSVVVTILIFRHDLSIKRRLYMIEGAPDPICSFCAFRSSRRSNLDCLLLSFGYSGVYRKIVESAYFGLGVFPRGGILIVENSMFPLDFPDWFW